MELNQLIVPFFRHREIQGDTEKSRNKAFLRLKKHFVNYLAGEGKKLVEDLTPELLKTFQEDLLWRQTKKGTLLSVTMRNHIVQTVKSFCSWLYQQEYLASDFSALLQYARKPQRLPYHVLEEKEMLALLSVPDTSTLTGYRDRVWLEILYGTGIRCGELRNIKLHHVDLKGGFLYIEQGKGKKDRVVPLTEGLSRLLSDYVTLVRPRFPFSQEHDYLIPSTQRKGPLSESRIERYLKAYAQKGGITKRVYPHLIRHTCATHLTRNGAPIRSVQELLGHSRIDSTQIYTHMTITDLKKAHKRYHPRERMKVGGEPPENKGD